MLAFSLVGNGNENDWGTYYGPIFSGKNEDGTLAYAPALESINIDAVRYWESRISQTHNPLMKMQYAGLVWDFKHRVCNDRYPSSLYDDYITSMIEVIKATTNLCHGLVEPAFFNGVIADRLLHLLCVLTIKK